MFHNEIRFPLTFDDIGEYLKKLVPEALNVSALVANVGKWRRFQFIS